MKRGQSIKKKDDFLKITRMYLGAEDGRIFWLGRPMCGKRMTDEEAKQIDGVLFPGPFGEKYKLTEK